MRTDTTAAIYEVGLQRIDLVMDFAKLEVDAGTLKRQINMDAAKQAKIWSLARTESRPSVYLHK